MIRKLSVRGFKSLDAVSVRLPRLAVLFGPNSAGKSNILEAVQALSRIGTERTLMEALGGGTIRGHPFEQIARPKEGFAGIRPESKGGFSLEAELAVREGGSGRRGVFGYRIGVELRYRSGALTNADESLVALAKTGSPKGKPAIEHDGNQFTVRRQRGGGRPRKEDLGQNYAILSDARLGLPGYPYVERTREELRNWRTYHLDPRGAMRSEMPPMDVWDCGVFGEFLLPFLYKLKGERPKHFQSVLRTLRTVVPNIEGFDVELNAQRGTLHCSIKQDGALLSSRMISEGTFRVLALCAIAANPWGGTLLALEEPENGVHPRRVELIAQMLASVALDQGRQVIVTTHSPFFCDAVLAEARRRAADRDEVGLFNVRKIGAATRVERFESPGPLFDDADVMNALTVPAEDRPFQSLLLNGLIRE